MFFDEKIPVEQHELIEYAQQRIAQKKRLYYHFIFFLVGALFLFITNKAIAIRAEWDWWLWVVVLWGFLLTIHACNVFIVNRFLGKAWERRQREKLIAAQKARITKLQETIAREFPMPSQKDAPSS